MHGNVYGTSRAAVQSVTDAGKVCVCEMDVQGVKQVSGGWQSEPKPYFLFIEPNKLPIDWCLHSVMFGFVVAEVVMGYRATKALITQQQSTFQSFAP